MASAVDAALGQPGGADLVVAQLSGLPGALATPAKTGWRARPASVQVGQWRVTPLPDGRLGAAHVVNGIVIAQEELGPGRGGSRVAEALAQHVAAHGPRMEDEVTAMVAGLLAAGGGY